MAITKKTQTSLRITVETLNYLKLIKKATRLPISTILEGIIMDHMELNHKRYLDMIKKRKKIKELTQQLEKEIEDKGDEAN